jgi:hypothetical protein
VALARVYRRPGQGRAAQHRSCNLSNPGRSGLCRPASGRVKGVLEAAAQRL